MGLNYEREMVKLYEENKDNPCKFLKMSVMLLTLASLDNNISLANYSKLCDIFTDLSHKVIKLEKHQN